jgi:hypothetical protein
MKLSNRILSRRGFLATSILGGLAAPFLKPESARAAPLASQAVSVQFSILKVPYMALDNVTTEFTKIGGNIGNVYIHDPYSMVEATYEGRLMVVSFGSGTSGVSFQIRINGSPPLFDVCPAEVMAAEAGQKVPYTFSGLFSGFPSGQYPVSIWAKSWYGTAWAAWVNPDGWGAVVNVKEYLPLGYTYLPLVTK